MDLIKQNKFMFYLRYGFVAIYIAFLIVFCSLYPLQMLGEWDDYCLMSASIINESNFTISESDKEFALLYFNEVADEFNGTELSDLYDSNHNELAMYFPTYSIMALPAIVILHILGLPSIYGFFYTNIVLVSLLLLVGVELTRRDELCKIILTFALALNPIMFYYMWASSEVALFVFVAFAVIFWARKNYNWAAISISIAGTMNASALAFGIVMIAVYLSRKLLAGAKSMKAVWENIVKEYKAIFLYGVCYLPSLVPFIYNYIKVGGFSLTVLHWNRLVITDNIFQRFVAYILDLNFGVLPYYGLILILFVCLLPLAVMHKKYDYLWIFIGFVGVVFAFSEWPHVNCGMLGMSRYCSWSGVMILLAVFMYGGEIFDRNILKVVFRVVETLSIAYMACIVAFYSRGNNASCMKMTPIASYCLDHAPYLYNPLYSTFQNRIKSEVGAPEIVTPLVYCNQSGNVRKILARKEDMAELLDKYIGVNKNEQIWFEGELNRLMEQKLTYISVGEEHSIIKKSQN